MREPSPPPGDKDGQSQRSRTRGAIRTHLGRKRTGPRARSGHETPAVRIQTVEDMLRRQEEGLQQQVTPSPALPQGGGRTLTYRSGDFAPGGTLTCEGCGWTLQTTHATLLPPCPRCAKTSFRKTS